ncbi:ABC transporter permease [Paenibacillus humicola]|uniref:ABC transporter permease n=1 Tax=Paenibacillus humicola TaxID=3110540 RepID=UPI00237BBC1E|nr:ABC transporter permease subunit [Paenibacillus humicola]
MEAELAQNPIGMSQRPVSLWKRLVQQRYIYLLMLPGILYFILFKLLPLWGLLLAFQNFSPFAGFLHSDWVGLKNFTDLFRDDHFYGMLRNTLLINVFGLVFFFPMPIILAIMLNEIKSESFKRINQSIVYMPHFLSWVVVASLTYIMMSTDVGMINKLLHEWGFNTVSFLTEPKLFWIILTVQLIWKDVGWGTIIFLAAIAGVDPQRYEAAVLDGANRWQLIRHVTLPAIAPTVIILLILRLGQMADVGFEQVLLMTNPLVNSVAEVFDTYAYNMGILRGNVSVGVAVGLFKGLVGLVLVMSSNFVTKKMGHEGIY